MRHDLIIKARSYETKEELQGYYTAEIGETIVEYIIDEKGNKTEIDPNTIKRCSGLLFNSVSGYLFEGDQLWSEVNRWEIALVDNEFVAVHLESKNSVPLIYFLKAVNEEVLVKL